MCIGSHAFAARIGAEKGRLLVSALHPHQAVLSHGAGSDGRLVPTGAQLRGEPCRKVNAVPVIGLVHHDVVRAQKASRVLRRHEPCVQLGRALVARRAAHGLAHELRPVHDLAHAPAKAGGTYHLMA